MKRNKARMKLFIVVILISTVVFATRNGYTQDDKDPEIMKAMLDSSNMGKNVQSDLQQDPLEEAINTSPADITPKTQKKIELKTEIIKPLVSKTKKIEKRPEVIKLTEEESEMLKTLGASSVSGDSDTEQEIKKIVQSSVNSNKTPAKLSSNKKPIYVPAPVANDKNSDEIVIDRDSSKVKTKYITPNDVINVYVCFNGGLTITLDDEVKDEFTDIRLDDKLYFDADKFDNKKGAFVHLIKPIPEGFTWETAIRFTRRSDDKNYIINLVGVACPKAGLSPFPKVIYLKEKPNLLTQGSKAMPPEDTIIEMSKGLPRIQKNRIRVSDMLVQPGSQWAVFSMEVQLPNNQSDTVKLPDVKVLNHLQVGEIKREFTYLPVHTKKVSELRGVTTMRYRLAINITKDYILKNRYVHLMYLDEEGGYYQYIRVDTLPYFLSLVKRGFDI